jgi:hypothetical protein
VSSQSTGRKELRLHPADRIRDEEAREQKKKQRKDTKKAKKQMVIS